MQSAPPLLRYPSLALSDGVVRLVPLAGSDADDLLQLAGDPAVVRFTPLPSDVSKAYIAEMLERCDRGWREGSGAFFSIRESITQGFLGYAAAIRLQLAARQGELGYMIAPRARGQGFATRALTLLTDWCFEELKLARVELRVNPRNDASVKVAVANGYHLEGLLRSVHLKGEERNDVGIWSRLPTDPGLRRLT